MLFFIEFYLKKQTKYELVLPFKISFVIILMNKFSKEYSCESLIIIISDFKV